MGLYNCPSLESYQNAFSDSVSPIIEFLLDYAGFTRKSNVCLLGKKPNSLTANIGNRLFAEFY